MWVLVVHNSRNNCRGGAAVSVEPASSPSPLPLDWTCSESCAMSNTCRGNLSILIHSPVQSLPHRRFTIYICPSCCANYVSCSTSFMVRLGIILGIPCRLSGLRAVKSCGAVPIAGLVGFEVYVTADPLCSTTELQSRRHICGVVVSVSFPFAAPGYHKLYI